MHQKNNILELDCPVECDKANNVDCKQFTSAFQVMTAFLHEQHRYIDPEKGIPASRRSFNLITFMLEGVMDVHLDTGSYRLGPYELLIVPENTVYASNSDPSSKGYCLHFKTEFIQPLLHTGLPEQFPFFNREAEHIVGVSATKSADLQRAFNDILEEYHKVSRERENLLRGLVYILLLRIREAYRPGPMTYNPHASRREMLSNQFRRLAERNFLQIREVKSYAEMLNITPQHLSEIVKTTLGVSPRKFINRMLTRESKILLSSTDKTLSEIAYLLRFDDQAHFNHFIKVQTGSTPNELRKKL